jgi:hypothetical protein
MDDFEKAVAEFIWSVAELFDQDWQYTKDMFPFIEQGGTFLEPHLDDEAENWGNRAFFLERFRKLRRLMRERGIEPLSPFRQCRLTAAAIC